VLCQPLWVLLHLAGPHGILTHLGSETHVSDIGIYRGMVWGALWGLLFYIPLRNTMKNFWGRCFIYCAPRKSS
jgi:hypothetical protein